MVPSKVTVHYTMRRNNKEKTFKEKAYAFLKKLKPVKCEQIESTFDSHLEVKTCFNLIKKTL